MSKANTHIIFDLGNVLIDIHPEATMEALAASCEGNPEEIRRFFLSPAHLSYMTGEIDSAAYYRAFCEQHRCTLDFAGFSTIWNRLIGTPRTLLGALAAQLSAGYTLSVCSNTDPLHWETARRRCGFMSYFSHFFLSFEMGCRKPAPEIYRKMLTVLAAAPEQCIFIDDTAENIRSARALGFRTIHSNTPEDIRQQLLSLLETANKFRG
ncbi:MAG: HAD family phosphatase [Calditrichaeota bacterium]|nr:HAD family phosphatase [Calditrichota bacterium]MCB0306604.1 HAD family phosphatase [Calditrichota bacterium]